MGSSVYSSFLLPSLLSGRMTLKTTVVLCLALVVFIEANPVPGNDNLSSLVGRMKRSPNEETENELNDDNAIIENELNELLDTTSNESEDTTDDSDVGDMDTSGRKKRSPRKKCPEKRNPYTCDNSI